MAAVPTSQTSLAAAEHSDGTPTHALLPAEPAAAGDTGIDLSGPVAKLPVELDVGVPIRDFRIRNLLALEPGVVVASHWGHGEDLPVLAGNQALAWSEFEVVDSLLAVRLTRLL